LKIDEAIRATVPVKVPRVQIEIVDSVPSGRMPDLPTTGPADPLPKPPTVLEISQRSVDHALGRR
jgi:hypothetical protein